MERRGKKTSARQRNVQRVREYRNDRGTTVSRGRFSAARPHSSTLSVEHWSRQTEHREYHRGRLPFSKRQGYLLLTIGDGLGWANVHTCAHLPAGVRTLYHLARLDRETIDRVIQEGVIHPALKESEAKRLLAQFQGKTAEDRQAKSRILQRLRRFEEFVRATLPDWTAVERQRATEGLTQLLEQIRRADGVKRNGAVSDFAGVLLNHHRNSL